MNLGTKLTLPYLQQVSSSSSSSLIVDIFIQPRRRRLNPALPSTSSSRSIVVFIEIHRHLRRDPPSSPSRSVVVSVDICHHSLSHSRRQEITRITLSCGSSLCLRDVLDGVVGFILGGCGLVGRVTSPVALWRERVAGFLSVAWKTSLVSKLFLGARLQVKPALMWVVILPSTLCSCFLLLCISGHSSFRRSCFLSDVEFGWCLFTVFSYVLLGVAFGYVPSTLKLLGPPCGDLW
ncbi:hypothetical protein F2Q70_00025454 [Brassica cretica]|uniref:Transmembrane protein n=1 Tax=Brassica cretica TaxID=69181 RepID=A0A8S9L8T5_BRACR|nr:hypothetical protein F2Q70_00025454 [Brassica cretica]